MSNKKDQKEKEKAIVKNEIVTELKEDADDIDLISLNVDGLVSIINDGGIKRYDTQEFKIEDIIHDFIQNTSSLNSFFLMDIGQIFRRYKLWKKLLPRVEIFYAVKCNPDKILLKTLSYFGVGFDVASKSEISMVDEYDVSRDKIVYANPIKEIDHIMFARSKGVTMMTFDNEDELKKISVFHPTAELILRLLVDDSKSKLPLGAKFGCPSANLEKIFILAKQLHLKLIGVSFHVGSGCIDGSAYCDAIKSAKDVFVMAHNHGYKFTLLDIGGGFEGHDDEISNCNFSNIATIINKAIDNHFNDYPELRIISEPGRFFATSCGTLVTNVIGKKKIEIADKKVFHYYINSNLYGMFNNIVFDKAIIKMNLLNKYPDMTFDSVIWGNSCDSMDQICENIILPELACGDWIYIQNHAAYTTSSGSTFNGLKLSDVKYIYTF